MKKKVMAARAKLEHKLGRPLNLYKKSGKSVSGGADLALSSAYTTPFAVAVFKAWFREWVLTEAHTCIWFVWANARIPGAQAAPRRYSTLSFAQLLAFFWS